MKRTVGLIALAAAGMLALSACSTGAGSAAPTAVDPTGGSTATCKAEKVGAVTRCDNFYTDYWPEINRQMDVLYQQAKKTDNGRLVIWGWYELSPNVIAQFNKKYPDIKIETKGLNYNLSSAIISAKATGSRNTDVVSGSITSMTAMYDQGFWEKVDWTKFGVPKEFFQLGAPEMLPNSINGSTLQYNTSSVDSVPATLDGLLDSKYQGKVSAAGYNGTVFSGYGMAHGKQAMVDLIDKLKSSGNMKLVDDQDTPLSSGDIPIALNQVLFNPNPALKVSAFEDNGVFAQFSGVNTDAKNKPAAMLWSLWNAYNPDWIKLRTTDPKFSTTQVPYPGLPASVFDGATGLMKKNADALLTGLKSGSANETMATRDQWNALIDAADKALGG